jgi:hypothetical protein
MNRVLYAGVAAFAFAGVASSGAQAANLVANGGFESVTGVTPDSWTIAPGTEIQDLTGADYIPCCGATGSAASLANHFASFGPGNVPNVSTLSQTIATAAGAHYALTFDAGAMGGGSEDIVASVYDGAKLLATETLTTVANNNLDTTFAPQTLNFFAGAGPTTISFNAVGDGANIDPILDNVAVAGVPEPAVWAMMLMGFGGLGVAMRRARRQGLAIAA